MDSFGHTSSAPHSSSSHSVSSLSSRSSYLDAAEPSWGGPSSGKSGLGNGASSLQNGSSRFLSSDPPHSAPYAHGQTKHFSSSSSSSALSSAPSASSSSASSSSSAASSVLAPASSSPSTSALTSHATNNPNASSSNSSALPSPPPLLQHAAPTSSTDFFELDSSPQVLVVLSSEKRLYAHSPSPPPHRQNSSRSAPSSLPPSSSSSSSSSLTDHHPPPVEYSSTAAKKTDLDALADAGVSLTSLLSIHSIFTSSGIRYQIATPSGAPASIANVDDLDELLSPHTPQAKRGGDSPLFPLELWKRVQHPSALRNVKVDQFAGLLIPHHLGASIDLFNSSSLGNILSSFSLNAPPHANQQTAFYKKFLCCIGYGVYALAAAKRSSGLRGAGSGGAGSVEAEKLFFSSSSQGGGGFLGQASNRNLLLSGSSASSSSGFFSSSPFANYTLTGVSAFDECRYPFFGRLPCMLQELLESQGAVFSSFECLDTPGMIVDRNLVTGANEISTVLCVQTFALLLCSGKKKKSPHHGHLPSSFSSSLDARHGYTEGEEEEDETGADKLRLRRREKFEEDKEEKESWNTMGLIVKQLANVVHTPGQGEEDRESRNSFSTSRAPYPNEESLLSLRTEQKTCSLETNQTSLENSNSNASTRTADKEDDSLAPVQQPPWKRPSDKESANRQTLSSLGERERKLDERNTDDTVSRKGEEEEEESFSYRDGRGGDAFIADQRETWLNSPSNGDASRDYRAGLVDLQRARDCQRAVGDTEEDPGKEGRSRVFEAEVKKKRDDRGIEEDRYQQGEVDRQVDATTAGEEERGERQPMLVNYNKPRQESGRSDSREDSLSRGVECLLDPQGSFRRTDEDFRAEKTDSMTHEKRNLSPSPSSFHGEDRRKREDDEQVPASSWSSTMSEGRREESFASSSSSFRCSSIDSQYEGQAAHTKKAEVLKIPERDVGPAFSLHNHISGVHTPQLEPDARRGSDEGGNRLLASSSTFSSAGRGSFAGSLYGDQRAG